MDKSCHSILPLAMPVCRIKPEKKSRFYCELYIWKDIRQMRRLMSTGKDVRAFFSPIDRICAYRDGKMITDDRRPAHIGELHFPVSSLRVGIISHECSHATIHWYGRRLMKKRLPATTATKENERFCYALGNLVRQVVWRSADLWQKRAGVA